MNDTQSDNRSYYLFEADIDTESINTLLTWVGNTKGYITIGIDSGGGDPSAGYFLSHALNQESHRVELVACGCVYSTAFDVLTRFPGRITVTPGCRGMTHYATISHTLRSDGKAQDAGESQMDQSMMKRLQKDTDDWSKKYMTTKERRLLKKGDVYFSHDRMLELFDSEHRIK